MGSSAEWRVSVATLAPGATAKFRLARAGRSLDGFVVRWGDAVHAFVNRCPHVGTPLDLWPNEFFTEDGSRLICSTHGALFEPDSGRCLAGPCAGEALTALPVRREGDLVIVTWPAADAGRAHGSPEAPTP